MEQIFVYQWEQFSWPMKTFILEINLDVTPIFVPKVIAAQLAERSKVSAETCCTSLNGCGHREVTHGDITYSVQQSGNFIRYYADFMLSGERRLLDADATLAACAKA